MLINRQLVNLNLHMLSNAWAQFSLAAPGQIKQEWSLRHQPTVLRQMSSHYPFCQDASAKFSYAAREGC